jgi:AhpD family alkylhydroperoxidase
MREVEWMPPLLELRADRDRMARMKASVGRVEPSTGYLLASDWLPEAAAELNALLFTRTHLEHELADLVGLAVSQDNSCRYCFAATRTLLVMVGYPRVRIARLEQNLAIAELDDGTRAAIAFARRLSRCDPPPTAVDVAMLSRAGVGGMAYRELAAAIGLWVFFNRLSTIPALPPGPMEALPDRWITRVMRPFVAGRVDRTYHRRARPVELPPAMREGACAEAVNALHGLAVAPALRRAIDAMWRSEGLPRRTRGLVCATIARALGCPTAEVEAVGLLADEGVDPAVVDGVLAHLDAPGLTDAERVLVRFARETVWYEPSPLQRRAREIREQLTEREFVEAVGTVSMANMLCRLHMALTLA